MTNFPTQDNHRGVDTSIDAAEMASTMSSQLRALVLKVLFRHESGLTVDELCKREGYARYSLQPRFTELKKLGLIRDSGERRRNESGANAIVWVATALDMAGAA